MKIIKLFIPNIQAGFLRFQGRAIIRESPEVFTWVWHSRHAGCVQELWYHRWHIWNHYPGLHLHPLRFFTGKGILDCRLLLP